MEERNREPEASELETEIAQTCGVLNAATGRLVVLLARVLEAGTWQVAGIHSPSQWVAWQCGVSTARARSLLSMARRRAELTALVLEIFTDSDETYGYRRVHAELGRRGVPAGLELIRAIMRDQGLVPCQPRPWRASLTENDGTAGSIPTSSTATSQPTRRARKWSATSPIMSSS